MRSLQPPDILWIHWRVYNSIANTSKGGTLLPPSDAYVRSFLYLLYTLIKLYYTHTKNSSVVLLHGLFILVKVMEIIRLFEFERQFLTSARTSLGMRSPAGLASVDYSSR